MVELALTFEERNGVFFDVEYAEQGSDIIYHFWPPGDEVSFRENFHRFLEDGFIDTLPPNQRVFAAHTSVQEAAVQNLVRQREFRGNGLVIPRETYFVRVYGAVDLPLYEKYLKHRIFERIEERIRES